MSWLFKLVGRGGAKANEPRDTNDALWAWRANASVRSAAGYERGQLVESELSVAFDPSRQILDRY